MSKAILVINSGSTSLKFALYQLLKTGLEIVAQGGFSGMPAEAELLISDQQQQAIYRHRYPASAELTHEPALAELINLLRSKFSGLNIAYAGHRIVLGGEKYTQAIKLDNASLDYLESLSALEPTHQFFEVKGARALAKLFPTIAQAATFDTSFHRSMPPVAEFYPVADAITKKGVRHWGFHGVSYAYISRQLASLVPAAKRAIVAHLGGGASLCAMLEGKSIDTSMQFGAITGLPMATRSGDFPVDAVFYLLKKAYFTVEELEFELAKHSGLVGVSRGLADNMRALELSSDPLAKKAMAYFDYAVIKYIGAYAAILEGLDVLVFTAGIGENDAAFRARILKRLAWLGVRFDPEANLAAVGGASAKKISTIDSAISVYVIPTNEELMIAQNVVELYALTAE